MFEVVAMARNNKINMLNNITHDHLNYYLNQSPSDLQLVSPFISELFNAYGNV